MEFSILKVLTLTDDDLLPALRIVTLAIEEHEISLENLSFEHFKPEAVTEYFQANTVIFAGGKKGNQVLKHNPPL